MGTPQTINSIALPDWVPGYAIVPCVCVCLSARASNLFMSLKPSIDSLDQPHCEIVLKNMTSSMAAVFLVSVFCCFQVQCACVCLAVLIADVAAQISQSFRSGLPHWTSNDKSTYCYWY